MAEVNPDSILDSLEGAFGSGPPVKAPAPAPEPPKAEEEAPEPVAAESEAEAEVKEDEEEGEPEQEAAPPDEPEFEVEVNGHKELVRGREQVTELIQKGLDYSRKAEINARNAEIVAAQEQHLRMQAVVNQQLFADVTELQSLDQRLASFQNIDWGKAFDDAPFDAMKLKEQRDQLREARAAKLSELQQKQQAILQGQAQAAQQVLAAEEKALLAKLPQWRNSKQAAEEKAAIAKMLLEVGYRSDEVGSVMDHRALVIARDALLYRQLQAAKADKTKQAREAPAMAKPGAANAQQRPNEKANFAKFQQELRKEGRKGNHYAQEQLMLKTLNRVFK